MNQNIVEELKFVLDSLTFCFTVSSERKQTSTPLFKPLVLMLCCRYLDTYIFKIEFIFVIVGIYVFLSWAFV